MKIARYVLNDINLADWKSICIIDNELDVVILHFNVTDRFSFETAVTLGQSIVDKLNSQNENYNISRKII
jgi:hypothetical protein